MLVRGSLDLAKSAPNYNTNYFEHFFSEVMVRQTVRPLKHCPIKCLVQLSFEDLRNEKLKSIILG